MNTTTTVNEAFRHELNDHVLEAEFGATMNAAATALPIVWAPASDTSTQRMNWSFSTEEQSNKAFFSLLYRLGVDTLTCYEVALELRLEYSALIGLNDNVVEKWWKMLEYRMSPLLVWLHGWTTQGRLKISSWDAWHGFKS